MSIACSVHPGSRSCCYGYKGHQNQANPDSFANRRRCKSSSVRPRRPPPFLSQGWLIDGRTDGDDGLGSVVTVNKDPHDTCRDNHQPVHDRSVLPGRVIHLFRQLLDLRIGQPPTDDTRAMIGQFHGPPFIVSRAQNTNRANSLDRESTMNDHSDRACKCCRPRDEASPDQSRIEVFPPPNHCGCEHHRSEVDGRVIGVPGTPPILGLPPNRQPTSGRLLGALFGRRSLEWAGSAFQRIRPSRHGV